MIQPCRAECPLKRADGSKYGSIVEEDEKAGVAYGFYCRASRAGADLF